MVKDLLEQIGAAGKTSREHVDIRMYNNKNNSLGRITNWGCCSSIGDILNIRFNSCNSNSESFATHAIMQINKSHIPNKFQNTNWLNYYFNFFNEISPEHFELTYLGNEKFDEKILPEHLKELSSHKISGKNCMLFSFKMQTNKKLRRLNLASLSWVRFLGFSRYWFYANRLIELRSNFDLEDINNLEILQLAAYGENKAKRSDLHGLYHYKSPVLAESYTYYLENDFNNILKSLNNGSGLNSSFCQKVHVYDIRYIRNLCKNGEYVTAYNCLINPVKKISYLSNYSVITAVIDEKEGRYKVSQLSDSNLVTTNKNIPPYTKIK